MIELNKKFESEDELATFCARVIANYCFKVGKCENCVFGIDHDGDGIKNMCFLTSKYLPCTWVNLMKCYSIIKKETMRNER
jgi:hypothetical protein